MLAAQTGPSTANGLAEIPRRDPGLVLIPALGLASIVLVLLRPGMVAVPLAIASVVSASAYSRCLHARAIRVSPVLVGAASSGITMVAVARPALYVASIFACLFAVAIVAMPKLEAGGVSDSLFASFLGVALLGIAPSHLGLIAVSPFAGGESMGQPLAVVVLLVTAAALGTASLASYSLEERSVGGAVIGGRIGADIAGTLAAVLVSLVASTIKRPQGSALDYLLLAVVISAAVALGRRLSLTFTSGGSDVQEIVWPQKIGDSYSLTIFLPVSLAFAASYYLAKLIFV